MGGSAGVAGAPPMGGSAGSTGATGPCINTMDCQACCDETFPNVRGEFASMMTPCACEVCYAQCGNNLCNTIYDWTEACLGCIKSELELGCQSGAQVCDGSSTCQPYAACVYSCL